MSKKIKNKKQKKNKLFMLLFKVLCVIGCILCVLVGYFGNKSTQFENPHNEYEIIAFIFLFLGILDCVALYCLGLYFKKHRIRL